MRNGDGVNTPQYWVLVIGGTVALMKTILVTGSKRCDDCGRWAYQKRRPHHDVWCPQFTDKIYREYVRMK